MRKLRKRENRVNVNRAKEEEHEDGTEWKTMEENRQPWHWREDCWVNGEDNENEKTDKETRGKCGEGKKWGKEIKKERMED